MEMDYIQRWCVCFAPESGASAAAALRRPGFGREPRAGFAGKSSEGGVISFRAARAAGPYDLGFFFVEKAGKGALGIVLDARAANVGFEPPPAMILPTAAARAALESERPATLAQGDIRCASSHAFAPRVMGEFFALPTFSNRLLGVKQIDGKLLAIDCFMQLTSIMRRALVQNGFGDGDLIEDGRPNPALRSRGCVAAAGHVDNFAVAGGGAAVAAARRGPVTRALGSRVPPVRSIDEASSVSISTGLKVNGDLGPARVKPSSATRLRQAILAVSRRGAASPRMLEVLLGHIAGPMLCTREALSILSSVYAFRSLQGPGARPLWAQVRVELRCVVSTLPFWTSHMNIPWGTRVSASDASPVGIGGVHSSARWAPRGRDGEAGGE
ncbi:unnamed protein product, partial [Prorocentrum cordatum]